MWWLLQAAVSPQAPHSELEKQLLSSLISFMPHLRWNISTKESQGCVQLVVKIARSVTDIPAGDQAKQLHDALVLPQVLMALDTNNNKNGLFFYHIIYSP